MGRFSGISASGSKRSRRQQRGSCARARIDPDERIGGQRSDLDAEKFDLREDLEMECPVGQAASGTAAKRD